MTSELPLIIRPAAAADEDFIVDSWVQSFLQNGDYAPNVRISVIKAGLRKLIPRLMNPDTTVVAAPESEPGLIAGWACGARRDIAEFALDGERNVLHYVYVRASYRSLGIATQLQAALGIDPTKPLTITHLTRASGDWPDATYDPYALFEVL